METESEDGLSLMTPAQLIDLKFAAAGAGDDDDEPGTQTRSDRYTTAFVKGNTGEDGEDATPVQDEILEPGRKVKDLPFLEARPRTATIEGTVDKWAARIKASVDFDKMREAVSDSGPTKTTITGNPSAMEQAWAEIQKERDVRKQTFMTSARQLAQHKYQFYGADEGETEEESDVGVPDGGDDDLDDGRDPLNEMLEEMERNSPAAGSRPVGWSWSKLNPFRKKKKGGEKKETKTDASTEHVDDDDDTPTTDGFFNPKKFIMQKLGFGPTFKPLTSHKVANAAKPPLPNADAIMSPTSQLSDIVGATPETVDPQLVRVRLPTGVNIVEQVQSGFSIQTNTAVTRVFPVTSGPKKEAFVVDKGNKKKGSRLIVTFKDQITGLERKLDATVDTSQWKDLLDARAWIASDGKYTVVFRFDGDTKLQQVIIVRDLISYKSLYDNKELSEIEMEMANHLLAGRSLTVESVKGIKDEVDPYIASIALATVLAHDPEPVGEDVKTHAATLEEINLFHQYANTLHAMQDEVGDEVDEVTLAHERGQLLCQAIAEETANPAHLRNAWLIMHVLATKGVEQDGQARLKLMDAAHPVQKKTPMQIVKQFLS